MNKWTYHRTIFTFCVKCEGKRWHEEGHFDGEKVTKKTCLKCYTTRELTDEEAKERNWS